MTKIFCDCCDKEGDCWKVQVPCHIAEEISKNKGYIDHEGNQLSGRNVGFDLCLKCWNNFFKAGYDAIKKVV